MIQTGSARKQKKSALDIKSKSQLKTLETAIKSTPTSLCLIWADWCGHCHEYMPFFDEVAAESSNNDIAFIKIHHDLQELAPEPIRSAKINGYPSVIKIHSDGTIESFQEGGSETNALPTMRDRTAMLAGGGMQKGGNSGVSIKQLMMAVFSPKTHTRRHRHRHRHSRLNKR